MLLSVTPKYSQNIPDPCLCRRMPHHRRCPRRPWLVLVLGFPHVGVGGTPTLGGPHPNTPCWGGPLQNTVFSLFSQFHRKSCLFGRGASRREKYCLVREMPLEPTRTPTLGPNPMLGSYWGGPPQYPMLGGGPPPNGPNTNTNHAHLQGQLQT